jgi:hypothetical protein
MKFIKTIVVLGSALMLLTDCAGIQKDKEELSNLKRYKRITKENLNIIITPDLSNRVQREKPVSDIVLIDTLIGSYYPNIYEYNNRISGQKDLLNLVFTNTKIITNYKYNGIFSIDINKKEEEHPLYLKTFDGTQTQFNKDKVNFVDGIKKVYEKAVIKPAGADIFSFFKDKLKNIVKKDVLNDTVQNYIIDTKFRNILVLFTDGYIEAGIYGKKFCKSNICLFLDVPQIKKFRNDYNNNNTNGLSMKEFFDLKKYGVTLVGNERLKDLEIFVCELDDRSVNSVSGSQREVPNDLDIIKLFWTDWLTKSGFKKITLKEKVSSVHEFNESFMNFLNNNE